MKIRALQKGYTCFIITLTFLLLSMHNADSQLTVYLNEPPESPPPRLHLLVNWTNGKPYLAFGPQHHEITYSDGKYYYYYNWDFFHGAGLISLGPGQNRTLTISNVNDRIYNPDIDLSIIIDSANSIPANIDFQLRCDGDGDGEFEFVVEFPETELHDTIMSSEPTLSHGQAIAMNNGTIELTISRNDDGSDIFHIEGTAASYIQVPFDLDTDGDGIGDYSDDDDDNDGHSDLNDLFPWDTLEWKDTDRDGIGDNEDDDDNGNGIPDDLEIPLVMGIVLIPLIAIMVVMNKFKKKGKEEEEGEYGEEDIPILTTPHEGPKNW